MISGYILNSFSAGNFSGNTQTSTQSSIPVVAVSPQPKVQQSHVDDFAGVSIMPTSTPLDYQSKIDWSKATITPQPHNSTGRLLRYGAFCIKVTETINNIQYRNCEAWEEMQQNSK